MCENCQTPYTGRDVGERLRQVRRHALRRKDDDPEAMRTRLRVYDEQTAPVLDWYMERGDNVAIVNAVGSVDDIHARAMTALGK